MSGGGGSSGYFPQSSSSGSGLNNYGNSYSPYGGNNYSPYGGYGSNSFAPQGDPYMGRSMQPPTMQPNSGDPYAKYSTPGIMPPTDSGMPSGQSQMPSMSGASTGAAPSTQGMSQIMDQGWSPQSAGGGPGRFYSQLQNLFSGMQGGMGSQGGSMGMQGGMGQGMSQTMDQGWAPPQGGSGLPPGQYGQSPTNLFQQQPPAAPAAPAAPPMDPATKAYMDQNYFPGIHGGPDPSMMGGLNQQVPGDMGKVAQVNQQPSPFARDTGPPGTTNGPGGLGFTAPGQPTQLFGPTAGLFGGAMRPPGTPNNFGYYPGTQQWGAPNMGWSSQWGKQPGT